MSVRLADPGTSLPPGLRSTGLFTPTRWSLVRRAAANTGELDEWLGLYWYPLYAWARQRGMSPEDAADGVQSFLEKLCTRNLLAKADQTRGKLRTWLLTAFSNHLSSEYARSVSQKRGGGATHIAIDWAEVESAYRADRTDTASPEVAFARAWALTVMEEALEVCARHYAESGRTAMFEALLPALDTPYEDDTYDATAARLGMNPATLRKAATRLRHRYRRALLDTAASRLGITCEIQLREELRSLLGG